MHPWPIYRQAHADSIEHLLPDERATFVWAALSVMACTARCRGGQTRLWRFCLAQDTTPVIYRLLLWWDALEARTSGGVSLTVTVDYRSCTLGCPLSQYCPSLSGCQPRSIGPWLVGEFRNPDGRLPWNKQPVLTPLHVQ